MIFKNKTYSSISEIPHYKNFNMDGWDKKLRISIRITHSYRDDYQITKRCEKKKKKKKTLDLPLVDASVARAAQPIVVPGHGIAAGEFAVEADGAAVAGNKSRYLKDNAISLTKS